MSAINAPSAVPVIVPAMVGRIGSGVLFLTAIDAAVTVPPRAPMLVAQIPHNAASVTSQALWLAASFTSIATQVPISDPAAAAPSGVRCRSLLGGLFGLTASCRCERSRYCGCFESSAGSVPERLRRSEPLILRCDLR